MTYDVCDLCWGSGDAANPWLNLRALEEKQKQWERDQVIQWLAERFAVNIESLRKRVEDLAELADKQANKRKLPPGEDPFWWARTWEAVAAALRDLAKRGEEERR